MRGVKLYPDPNINPTKHTTDIRALSFRPTPIPKSDTNPNAGWRRACELPCGGAEQDLQPEDTQHGVEARDRVRVRVGGLQPEDTQHSVQAATCYSGSDLSLNSNPDSNPSC